MVIWKYSGHNRIIPFEINGDEVEIVSNVKESLLIFPYVHKIISLVHIGISCSAIFSRSRHVLLYLTSHYS
jgi:hypothetical protein